MPTQQILLIEDSEAHAELARRALAEMACTIVVVSSLEQARTWLATNSPIIVLSDLQLPDGTAISLLSDYAHGVPWPVVVMTGFGDESLAVSSIKAGALEYVVKSPENIRQLPRTVDRALRDWGRVLEHKSTQKALLASEERLRLAMEATSDGLWDWDLATGEVYWSSRSFTMLGYHAQQFSVNYEVWRELLHPEDRERSGEELWRQVKAQGYFSIEFRLRTQHGAWRWINGKGKPVAHDEHGHILRMVGTHVDIDERVLSEQRLLETKKRYELLFEQAKDMVFVLDADTGGIQEMNTTAERILGWSRAELIGKEISSIQPQELRVDYERVFKRAAEGHLDTMDVIELLSKDGRRVPAELAASSIKLPTGQIVVQCVFRDVSERLQLEAQLRQAQKMEAIGQLAGGVAHDFNNVLAAIMLQISMLQSDKRMPAEVASTLNLLEASAKRAADLTRQLLLFGRRQPAKMQPLDLDYLVTNLLKMLRRLIGENIVLDFTPRSPGHWSSADQGMIEQVIMNLVVNSRDAMPSGGRIIITIKTVPSAILSATHLSNKATEAVEAYQCLTVSDTGQGIDEATQRRLFEPFFSTKPLGKGTGLGLATAYSIAKTHQGWIEVVSKPEQGASFSLFLPAVNQVAPAHIPAELPPLPVPRSAGILLVEDDALVRTFTSLSLKSAGYTVFEATDGRAALEKWDSIEKHVQFLVTDMVMPSGLSGWDLAVELRKARAELPVVIMSGYASDLPPVALKTPGLAFLQKPFDSRRLVQAMRLAEARLSP